MAGAEANPSHTIQFLEKIGKNTSLSVRSEDVRRELRHRIIIPSMVRNCYILEEFVLDALSLVSGRVDEFPISEDSWTIILEGMIKAQGFHSRLIVQVWCLTQIRSFQLALCRICTKRLTTWETKRSFYGQLYEVKVDPSRGIPKTDSLVYSLATIFGNLPGKPLDFGSKIHLSYSHSLMKPMVSEVLFEPHWIPIGPMFRQPFIFTFPIWMLSWFTWIESRFEDNMSDIDRRAINLIVKNEGAPYRDVVLTNKECSHIWRIVNQDFIKNECNILNEIKVDFEGKGLPEMKSELKPLIVRVHSLSSRFD